MAVTIQTRRGLAKNLPVALNEGEFAFTTDTHLCFIGDGTNNHEVLTVNSAALDNITLVGGCSVNDLGVTDLDLWTAEKTKSYTDALVNGVSWQDPILDQDLFTPPTSPTIGDRYIIANVGIDAWTSHSGEIAEWNGAEWEFVDDIEGLAVYIVDEDKLYTYNGTSWVTFGSVITHNNSTGLDGGTVGEYYHLTSLQYSTLTGNITDTDDKYIALTVNDALDELGETKFWNGFDRQDIPSMGTLAWDDSSQIASIDVASGESSFHFWCDGKKIIKSSKESVTIPNVTGLYYTYFDNAGVLRYTTTPTSIMFHSYAIVHLVRWNKTQGTGGCGHEQHGIRMSGTTHMAEHMTTGAKYESGMDILGLVDNSETYTQTTSGYFWDEDIRHTVDANTTGHSWMYRLGADGEWTTLPKDLNVGYNGGSGDGYWNEYTGTIWQLTRMGSSTDYTIVFFVATPSLASGSIVKIMGHGAYKDRNKARAAIETERSNLHLEGLPSTETLFLYAIIVRQNGDLEDFDDDSVFYDLRLQRGGGTGSSNSVAYAADIPTDVTNFGGALSSTDTDVQLALDTLDNIVDSLTVDYTLINRETYTIVGTEDTFLVDYTGSGNVDVFLNAAKLDPAEYSAITGTNVVLNIVAHDGDVVNLIGYAAILVGTVEATAVTYDNLIANGDVGIGGTQVSKGDHNHDSAYSGITHNHDSAYSGITHDHISDALTDNALAKADGVNGELQNTGIIVDDDNNVSGGGLTANIQTGTTYSLILTDAGKIITLNNASAITLTIPANASVVFPIGTCINLLSLGVGIVTISITTDTLLSKDSSVTLTGQYSTGSLVKITTTSWVLFGDIS